MFKRFLSYFKPVEKPPLTRVESLYLTAVEFHRVCTDLDVRVRCSSYISTKAPSVDALIVELTSLVGIIKYRENDGYYDKPAKWLYNAPTTLLFDHYLIGGDNAHVSLRNCSVLILELLKTIVEEVPKHNEALVLYYNNKPKLLYAEVEEFFKAFSLYCH